jgi:hypothetical protein
LTVYHLDGHSLEHPAQYGVLVTIKGGGDGAPSVLPTTEALAAGVGGKVGSRLG